MEVKGEKNDFMKLEPRSIDVCVNDDDQKKPFFTSVDNPIKVPLTTFFIFCRNTLLKIIRGTRSCSIVIFFPFVMKVYILHIIVQACLFKICNTP
ncbi:hypothetical protein C0J52_09415 [Blattella germanica]|nr:hypothetical protein C0J52_09415 [Blattella germanica]